MCNGWHEVYQVQAIEDASANDQTQSTENHRNLLLAGSKTGLTGCHGGEGQHRSHQQRSRGAGLVGRQMSLYLGKQRFIHLKILLQSFTTCTKEGFTEKTILTEYHKLF